jgi:glyceraldehyde 3-phosphate dehydrogenase
VTIAIGVNSEAYDPAKHTILSAASCTTNCLAPTAKVLLDAFGIEKGLMTTVHSYTNDQRHPRPDPQGPAPRPGGGAVDDPTSTGRGEGDRRRAPALKGKMHGVSVRVPTPNVSLVDLTVVLGRRRRPRRSTRRTARPPRAR